MPKYYSILDNGVSPMASKKSGYNKSGGKKNDPNRSKFVDKYVKQNTKSADRPATKKQARNAYYLTSADDKKGARGIRRTGGSTKTTSGSSMRTRADGNKPGSPAGRKSGMGQAGPNVRAGVGQKATYPGKSAGMAGASKESRVAGRSTRNPSTSKDPKDKIFFAKDGIKSRNTRAKEGMGVRGRLKGEQSVYDAGGMLNKALGYKAGRGRGGAAREGLGSSRAKTSSKAPRSAPKATGRRDKNRRTY
jgi:hypothetical protein